MHQASWPYLEQPVELKLLWKEKRLLRKLSGVRGLAVTAGLWWANPRGISAVLPGAKARGSSPVGLGQSLPTHPELEKPR